jgi:gliding motility-associated protein GldM
MAGYKETPRQKMIGMMYLVLTALLALNVSKQMLDAFVVVNETMENTNSNFNKKLDNTLAKFKVQYDLYREKVGPYWQRAQKARQLSENMAAYIDSLKYTVISRTERISFEHAKKMPLDSVKRKDSYEDVTNFFIGSSHDGSGGESIKLKHRIEAYKKEMISLLDPKYQTTMKLGLRTEGKFKDSYGEVQNWEMHNFYHTILAAAVTILNQMKADVYNAEFDVVNSLFAAVSAEDWKFDEIRAKVIPKSAYVFTGEDYTAEILVAAYDSKADPDVRYVLGADTLTPAGFANATRLQSENGVVTLKLAAGAEGLKKFAGLINIVAPNGTTQTYPFHDEFIVAKPAVTISPTKMNVFYISLENPVSLSVPGSPEKIMPSISPAGSIVRDAQGKDWIVKDLPNSMRGKQVTITVNAVFQGKTKKMGEFNFRCKTVPPPVARIAGTSGGQVSRDALGFSYVVSALPAEQFDFDLKYKVVSFTYSYLFSGKMSPDINVTGDRLPQAFLDELKRARKGDKVWIDNIKAVGPEGARDLPSINLKLN